MSNHTSSLSVRVASIACDICHKSEPVMYDARSRQGPWGFFCTEHFHEYCYGTLGTGCGQKFHRQPDGRYLKVAG